MSKKHEIKCDIHTVLFKQVLRRQVTSYNFSGDNVLCHVTSCDVLRRCIILQNNMWHFATSCDVKLNLRRKKTSFCYRGQLLNANIFMWLWKKPFYFRASMKKERLASLAIMNTHSTLCLRHKATFFLIRPP